MVALLKTKWVIAFAMTLMILTPPLVLPLVIGGDANVSRDKNLQSSPLDSNNADLSRTRNLQSIEAEPNNADLSRTRSLQPLELGAPTAFWLTVEVMNETDLPIQGANVNIANITLLTNSSGFVTVSLGYGVYNASVSLDPYYLPTSKLIDLYNDTTVVFLLSRSPGSEFDVSLMPDNITTSIGGNVEYTVTIDNYAETSDSFLINVTGLDQSWYSLEKNPVHLIAGEISFVTLTVSVPELISAIGNYSIQIRVSELLHVSKNISAQLLVVLNPIMYNLRPDNDIKIGSTKILISWTTSSNASSEVYFKQVRDSVYDHTVEQWGTMHFVYIFNLTRNVDYVWYAHSNTTYGNVTSTERMLYVSNGISFVQDVYTFNVERDYAQRGAVSVINDDSQSHDLLLNASNPYDDLIVGFVGDGSMDQGITLVSGETKNTDFYIFAQDAMLENYAFIIELTNLGAENIYDYALVRVKVRQPDLNLTLTEVGIDPWTLTKTLNVTNHGDTITDLRIDTDDSLVGKVEFTPIVWHAYLLKGSSFTFDVVPLLDQNFTSYVGFITAEGAGKTITSLPVNFTLPNGMHVFTVSTPQVRIEFSEFYDTDISPNTNPLPGQPVETYLTNGSLFFAGQIVVNVFQNDRPASMANVSLTLWNGTGSIISVEWTETDFTGKAMFVVLGFSGDYSYQAELVGYDLKTETRNFSTDDNSLFEIHAGEITWLDVSDGNSTFASPQNLSAIVLDKSPFVFRGYKGSVDQNMTVKLCLSWDSDPYKRVFVDGEISNNTMVVNATNVPIGNFTGILMCYSVSEGFSFSDPINVTCLDSSGMYAQGSFSYQLPFPLNATHLIQLTIDHDSTPLDPNVFLELADIEPSNSSLEYILDYIVVSNQTSVREINISAKTEDGQQFYFTGNLSLEAFTPIVVNFAVPIRSANGSLVRFNATAVVGDCVVQITVRPRERYYYDLRIWVGSFLGGLEDWWNGDWDIDPYHTIRTAITCGIGSFPPVAAGKAIAGVKLLFAIDEMMEGKGVGKPIQARLIKEGARWTGDMAQVMYQQPFNAESWLAGKGWGETAVNSIITPIIYFDSVWNCINDYKRALDKMPPLDKAFWGTVDLFKLVAWYCTNRAVVAVNFAISNVIAPASTSSQVLAAYQVTEAESETLSLYPQVDRVYLVSRFTLPWALSTYRPHDVSLELNGVRVGLISSSIPEGHYAFEVYPSILNYPASSPVSNMLVFETKHMNGGHYVVVSDSMVMIVLRQLEVSVVASTQQEAEARVSNITQTKLANKPDPAVFSEDIDVENNPGEGIQTLNVTVWNLGAAHVQYVPVLISDGNETIMNTLAFIPLLSKITIPVRWNATAGPHTIRVVVNWDNSTDELSWENDVTTKDVIVASAHDVALIAIQPSKTIVGKGMKVEFNVTSENAGMYPETFNVTLYAEDIAIETRTIDLASETSLVFTLTWNTAGFAYGNHTMKAYAWPLFGETNTTDNSVTYSSILVTIAGDINGDFKVDIFDAIILAGHFNQTPIHPSWNTNVDINGDNIVDIYDAIILANHYNQHYP